MKLKLLLNIVTLIAVGLLLLFGWSDIKAAVQQMLSLDLWVLALIIPAQFFAFFAVAKVYFHYFKAIGQPIGIKTLLPTTIELNFVNHIFPSGGVSGFSYLTIRLKRDGISTAKSTLAQLVRFGLAFVTFTALLVVGVFMLSVEDLASGVIIFIATSLTSLVVFGTLGLMFVISSERRITLFSNGLAAFLNRLIHFFRPKHPETIRLSNVEKTFRELHKDYKLLRGDIGKMKYAVAWALVANTAEVSLVYITFLAHDAWVNPGAVVIAYAVATIAGLLAILPGGVGVYEPLMVAVLVSAGISPGVALSVTLVSRVATLLLALCSGFVLYQLAIRRYAKHRSQR